MQGINGNPDVLGDRSIAAIFQFRVRIWLSLKIDQCGIVMLVMDRLCMCRVCHGSHFYGPSFHLSSRAIKPQCDIVKLEFI